MRFILTLVAALLIPGFAIAEIEKIAVLCDAAICFRWWPKLPVVEGWQQDKESSFHYRMNAQAPVGERFNDAEAVIYAVASFKPENGDIKDLAQFIDSDHIEFRKADPAIRIEADSSLLTADGQKLHTYRFTPDKPGSFELVAYGEEGEFYLVFTLSAKTPQGFSKARADFEKFLARYKAKP